MIKWRYYRRFNLWRAFWVEERYLEYFYGGGNVLPCVAVINAVKEPRTPKGRPVVVLYAGVYIHARKGYTCDYGHVEGDESPRAARKRLVQTIESNLRRYRCGCGVEVPAYRHTHIYDDYDGKNGGVPEGGISWAEHMCARDWQGRKIDRHSCTVLPKYQKASPIVGEDPSVNPDDRRDPIDGGTLPDTNPIGNPQRAAGGTDRLESSARSQDDDTRDGKQTQTRMAGFTDLYNLLFAHPSEASRANGARYLRASECADLRDRVKAILTILENIEGDL